MSWAIGITSMYSTDNSPTEYGLSPASNGGAFSMKGGNHTNMKVKRILSFLLVLVMMLSMLPAVYAAEVEAEPVENTEPTEPTPEGLDPALAELGFTSDVIEQTLVGVDGPVKATRAVSKLATLRNCGQMDFIQSDGRIQGFHYADEDGAAPWDYMNMIFCLESGKDFSTGSGHAGSGDLPIDGTGNNHGEKVWYNLTADQRVVIGLILLYGAPTKLWDESWGINNEGNHDMHNPNIGYRFATQALIWEITCNMREATYPYNRTSSYWYDPAVGQCTTADGSVDHFVYAYNSIINDLLLHNTIPSFAGDFAASAPEIQMSGNSVTVTDTNGVLSRFNFTNSGTVSYSKSGNDLTITATGAVPTDVQSATATLPNAKSSLYEVWYNQYDYSKQALVKVSVPASDPVPAYFKLKASTGSLALKKDTEDSKNLAGWQFYFYADAGCTKLISGPHTTDAYGNISVTGLSAGDIWVKEIGHSNAAINALYSCDSTNPQKVTIVSGQTASVSFYNKLNLGGVKLIKKTNTGNNLGGWSIGLYTDAACKNPVSGSPFTTAADGTITVTALKPGTYYAKELPGGDSYWVCDTAVKTVTVVANQTASVTFSNTHYGRIAVQKHTNTGNHLGGWIFTIRDSNGNVAAELTTDDNGYAVTGNLPLGKYTIQEKYTDDDYWQVELGFHDVTVKAGETVVDEWTNIEQGLGWFYKETNTADSNEGWEITIYTDEACTQEYRTVVTGEGGKIGLYLDPGVYWAKETGDTLGRFNDEYWQIDPSVQRFEIKPHKDTSITFQNVHLGKVKIIKVMENEGSAAGWPFKITDETGIEISGSPFITSADGTILTGNLRPGVYTIEELIPEDSLYFCTSQNPQTITVTEGKTVEVTFTNALRPGEISTQKVDVSGDPLAGAKFILEWSEDGTTWNPVFYSDSTIVVKGGCSNPDVVDGTLITPESGIITWSNLYPTLQYRITELEAPEGFQLLNGPAFEGELPVDDLTVTVRVVNSRIFTLPQTGSKSLALMPIGLILCAAVCMGALFVLRKKKGA